MHRGDHRVQTPAGFHVNSIHVKYISSPLATAEEGAGARADGGGYYTIWPHEYELSSALSPDGFRPGEPLKLQDMKIDTYACGPELNGSGKRDGIGRHCANRLLRYSCSLRHCP